MIDFKNLIDRELIKIIKNPETSEFNYQLACNEILNRYSKQIHKNWWVLQKQMNDTNLVNSLKEDYYDEAYEAFFIAIQKTDINKIEDDNWKFVGMLNWYLANVRKKLRNETKKQSKFKCLSTMTLVEDEDSNIIDSDVEQAYQFQTGFKENPEYVYEITENEEKCRNCLSRCFDKWSETEKSIYELLEKGNSKATIARELDIDPHKIYAIVNRMCKDVKIELSRA